MKQQRIYIACSMKGHDDFNFPLFFQAEEFLASQGYDVVNPAQLDIDAGFPLERLKQLSETEFKEFLNGATKRDLDALQGCDGIVMLPGWESSKGARAEKAVAEWMHRRVGYLNKDAGDGEIAGDWWLEWEGEKQNAAPQPDADGWIPHVPGDPMPCDGNLLVDVKIQNGLKPKGKMASCFSWGDIDEHGIGGVNITAWRPHQPQPKQPYSSDERAEWDLEQPKFHPNDPKGAAGAKKCPMHLLPPVALEQIAWVMGLGASKYGPWNFIEADVCASTYIGALLRHWSEFAKGVDIDPESGLPHLAHIAANCAIVLTAQQQGSLVDDRPKLK
jgi:hypothetical protein